MENTEKILTSIRDDILSLIDLFRNYTKEVMADPNYRWNTQTPFWSKVFDIHGRLSYPTYKEYNLFQWLISRDTKEWEEWLEYQTEYLKPFHNSQLENLRYISKVLMNNYSTFDQMLLEQINKWDEFRTRYWYLVEIEKDLQALIIEVQYIFILPDVQYIMELNNDMFNFPIQHDNYTINFREMYDNQVQILNIYCYRDLGLYHFESELKSRVEERAFTDGVIIPVPLDRNTFKVGDKYYNTPCLVAYDEFIELMKLFRKAGEWLNKNLGVNEPDNGEFIWSV